VGAKFTVLVVDDDPGILETMADILDEMNFKVSTASDGYQAIEMMKSGSYDAVMMDVRMPGIDGIETLKRIKETKPDAKVILMTAYASQDMVLAARKEGASTVLYKPIDLDKIEALLRKQK
jgi:DNA-binding NtrC family response regulator